MFPFLGRLFGNKADAAGRLPSHAQRLSGLTARERELFELLLQGFTLRYCAEQMGIRYSTANTHQNAVYRKLGVQSRAMLILLYKDLV